MGPEYNRQEKVRQSEETFQPKMVHEVQTFGMNEAYPEELVLDVSIVYAHLQLQMERVLANFSCSLDTAVIGINLKL